MGVYLEQIRRQAGTLPYDNASYSQHGHGKSLQLPPINGNKATTCASGAHSNFADLA